MSKLDELVEETGMDVHELLEEAAYDSVAQGICTEPGCRYTTTVEPDCRDGYCEACGQQSVQSCLVLAGLL